MQRDLSAHYVLVPAHDSALVDAWFRLGFGLQHVHGICEVPDQPSTPPAHLTIRAARRDDIPVLAELDLALPAHQATAPTWSAGEVPTLEEAVADWEESFDDEGWGYLVAEHDGRVVGAAVGCALEESSTHKSLTLPGPCRLPRVSRRCSRRRAGSVPAGRSARRPSTGCGTTASPVR